VIGFQGSAVTVSVTPIPVPPLTANLPAVSVPPIDIQIPAFTIYPDAVQLQPIVVQPPPIILDDITMTPVPLQVRFRFFAFALSSLRFALSWLHSLVRLLTPSAR
jgi:hypothetical protein